MPLNIAGITKMSTTDWPGKVVITVFLQGCPWNCEYCHNSDMIPFTNNSNYDWEKDVIALLKKRQGLLDGLVFSGGEPTSQNLEKYIKQVKDLGFLVGLHSQGANFNNFKKIINSIDWVGFDFKALPEDIDTITRTKNASVNALKSFELLIKSGVDFEIRTTYGPGVFDKEYGLKITDFLKKNGVKKHSLQNVRTEGARDSFVKKYTEEMSSKK